MLKYYVFLNPKTGTLKIQADHKKEELYQGPFESLIDVVIWCKKHTDKLKPNSKIPEVLDFLLNFEHKDEFFNLYLSDDSKFHLSIYPTTEGN